MKDIAYLKDDPRFQHMVRQRLLVTVSLSVLVLLLGASFFLAVAYYPQIMARPAGGNASLGIWLGLGFVVVTIVLSAFYTWWANAKFDVLKEQFLADLDLEQDH